MSLLQGEVTTESPSYISNEVAPLSLTSTGNLRVDGSSTVQPVSAAALPLPTNAATATNQDTANTSLASIDAKLTSPISITGSFSASPNINVHDASGNPITSTTSALDVHVSNAVSTSQSGIWNVNNISGAVSLPTGAATSSKQPGLGTAGVASSDVITVQGITSMTPIKVDGSGVTQPISGSVTSNIGITGGLALDSSVTAITTTLGTPFQSGGTIGNTSFTATQATGGNLHTVVDSGSVSVSSSTLPIGASTSVLQSTANTSLASIDSKLTSPIAVTGTFSSSPNINIHDGSGTSISSTGSSLNVDVTNTVPTSQSGSWTVTSNAGTNLNTSLLALDTSVNGIIVPQASVTLGESGPLTQGAVTLNAPTYVTGQTNPLSLTTAGALRTDSSATIQPISGAVTANAGTGTLLVDGSAHTQPISGSVTANVGTTGGLALDSSLTSIHTTLGSPFQSGGSIGNTSFIATQATGTNLHTVVDSGSISVSASALPSGASTSALQSAGNTSLSSIVTNTTGLAQDTSINGILVAQGSTTIGQSGPLSQTATTTNAPVYVTAKTNPLSTDISGNLRVSLKDSPANTSKFLVTTDPITFASPQHVIADASSAVIGHVIVDTAPSTAVTNIGTFAVQSTLAAETTKVIGTVNISSAQTIGLVAGSALVGKVGIDQTTPGTTNGVQVNAAIPAGTNVIGKVGIDQTTPGTTNLVALAANQSVNTSQINGTTPLMGNGITGTGSQRVTIASDNTAFTVNSAQSGTWTVQPGNTANTTAWKVDGSAVTQPVSGTVTANAGTGNFTVIQSTPASLQVTATQQTLTKGTQGSTGISTQDLKDAGRNQTNYFMAAQVLSTASEALQSLTGYKGGAAVGATTTPAVVTTGKTYRIQRVTITYVAVATAGSIQVNLRANTGGVVALTSPLVYSWLIGAAAAVAGVANTFVEDIPDGIEFPAGAGIGVTILGIGATGSAAVVGYAKVSVAGYEY